MTKKKTPEIKVVFDTNVLYTGSCSDLLSEKAKAFIDSNSCFEDLTIRWFLPDVVVREREFQMLSRGTDLLPSVTKLEKLLGHNLAITPEILHERVRVAIEKNLSELSIEKLNMNLDAVKWDGIIERSIYRKPPFDPGENEKGFRDALIAETFLGIVADSHSTPSSCRLVMVSGDEMLREYLEEQTSNEKNVHIFEGLEDLKGLLNTLASEVALEYIEGIQEKVAKYFFEKENEGSLYYAKKINVQVIKKFSKQLEEFPVTATSRENRKWYISHPRFVSKSGQRITWKSQIDVEAISYALGAEVTQAGLLGQTGLFGLSTPKSSFSTLLGGTQKNKIANGRTVFEVEWSVLVTTKKTLRNPKIEKAVHVETIWELASN